MKTKKIATILIISSVAICVGVLLYKGIREFIINPSEYTETMPVDYNGLFNQDALQKLASTGTLTVKLRNAISYLRYDKKYNLELTKIDISPRFKLTNDIIEGYTQAAGHLPLAMVPFEGVAYNTSYKSESTAKASKIYLSLVGDSVKTLLKNDSMAYYYLKLKNAYVQYKLGDVYEIEAQTNTKLFFFDDEPPVSLLFVKKQNELYYLFLTISGNTKSLDPNLLYSLLAKG